MINYQNILISIQIKLNFIRFKNNISLKKNKKKKKQISQFSITVTEFLLYQNLAKEKRRE